MKTIRSAFAITLSLALALPAQERVDLPAVHRIREEALNNSKVMDTLFQITEVIGARVTGSPAHKAAAEYAVKRLQEHGASAKLEKWEFGRGWSYSHFDMHMVEPTAATIIGYPLAWTPGTNGTVGGEVIFAPITSPADFARYKGKLRDKIVLMERPRDLTLPVTPFAKRYTEAELEEMELAATMSGVRGPGEQSGAPQFALPLAPGQERPTTPEGIRAVMTRFRDQRSQFLKDEGVLLTLSAGTKGEGGTVFGTSGGSQDPKSVTPPPMAAIATEHYNRLHRLISNKIPVKVEFNIKSQFHDESKDSFNVIGEIAGTGKNKDEYVMIGAHLDSWQGATGATDNGASCAAMIETLRVLKASGVTLNRSVKVGLWSGEEQGLLGSRAWVKEHLADRETMQLTKEHGRISAYFNIDNGVGKIRGIYTQGNDMVKPVFEQWFAPLKDLGGALHVTGRNTGSTDHVSFDAVGIPAFQFIQDPMDYSSRTHHSNMDTYDRIQRADLMQEVAVLASFVYHTANRDEMLPRKPLPKAPPKRPEVKKDAAPASSGGN
ncbi:MAG: M20/M25/M40 family metallo-hydrolase [Bryobacteraceae bacterium]|nr:M20/M25/M40 family metallo-hydrolase [Bryobacteraceae bacterium]